MLRHVEAGQFVLRPCIENAGIIGGDGDAKPRDLEQAEERWLVKVGDGAVGGGAGLDHDAGSPQLGDHSLADRFEASTPCVIDLDPAAVLGLKGVMVDETDAGKHDGSGEGAVGERLVYGLVHREDAERM